MSEEPDYASLAPLVCVSVVALPVVWVLACLLSPFVLVWLAGRWVYLAIKERRGVLTLRETHRNRSTQWHGENMRDCCRMLGGKEEGDIEAYVRVQCLTARYYKRNWLHDKDDAWWAEVLSYAKRDALHALRGRLRVDPVRQP